MPGAGCPRSRLWDLGISKPDKTTRKPSHIPARTRQELALQRINLKTHTIKLCTRNLLIRAAEYINNRDKERAKSAQKPAKSRF
jgi:hypothetical protein